MSQTQIITLTIILLILISASYAMYSLFVSAKLFYDKADEIEAKAKAAKTKKELEYLYNECFIPFSRTCFHERLSARIRELNMMFLTKYENMPDDSRTGYAVEYQKIKKHYGNQVAKRSKVPLINHIDEGIAILKEIGANNDTIAAYCLHPLLQADDALTNNIHLLDNYQNNFRVILTMEYRRVANNYLSKRTIQSLDDIELSPLRGVNQMLWADKLQNQKDFRLYHLGKHERSDILEQYFINWINKLEPIIKKY